MQIGVKKYNLLVLRHVNNHLQTKGFMHSKAFFIFIHTFIK